MWECLELLCNRHKWPICCFLKELYFHLITCSASFFLKCQSIEWLHKRYIIVLWLEDDTGHREMTLIYQSVCQYEYIKAVSRQHNTSRLIGISLVQTFTVIWTTPCANSDIHIQIHSCTLACAWDWICGDANFFFHCLDTGSHKQPEGIAADLVLRRTLFQASGISTDEPLKKFLCLFSVNTRLLSIDLHRLSYIYI